MPYLQISISNHFSENKLLENNNIPINNLVIYKQNMDIFVNKVNTFQKCFNN